LKTIFDILRFFIKIKIEMNTSFEQIKNHLKEKSIRPTYQRIIILKYLKESKGHPTIDMIHKDLVSKIPTISKTTIYNALNTFVERGLVAPVAIPDVERRFDGDTSWHHHFLCTRCGRIIDLDVKCEYLKKGEVEGHKINQVYGYFKGICNECRKKEN